MFLLLFQYGLFASSIQVGTTPTVKYGQHTKQDASNIDAWLMTLLPDISCGTGVSLQGGGGNCRTYTVYIYIYINIYIYIYI